MHQTKIEINKHFLSLALGDLLDYLQEAGIELPPNAKISLNCPNDPITPESAEDLELLTIRWETNPEPLKPDWIVRANICIDQETRTYRTCVPASSQEEALRLGAINLPAGERMSEIGAFLKNTEYDQSEIQPIKKLQTRKEPDWSI